MGNFRRTFNEFSQKLDQEMHDKSFKGDLGGRFVVMWTLISRIPLPKSWWPEEMPEGHRCLALAPLAGGLMGLISGLAVNAAAAVGLNIFASAWVGAAVYFAAGWSIHLDGWGDLWDGIGSGRSGEGMRKIMKDSHVGSFGVAAMIIAFGLWTSLVANISPSLRMPACITAGAAARFASAAAAYIGEYPWEDGMSRGWVDSFTPYDLFISVICLVVFLPLSVIRFPICAVAAGAIGLAVGSHMNKRLGGVSGDVLGACAVAAELLSLAVWAAL